MTGNQSTVDLVTGEPVCNADALLEVDNPASETQLPTAAEIEAVYLAGRADARDICDLAHFRVLNFGRVYDGVIETGYVQPFSKHIGQYLTDGK